MSEAGSQIAEAKVVRQPSTPEQLRQFAEGGFLYAVTDGAGEPLLTAMFRELGPTKAYPVVIPGVSQQELIPYVVAIDSLLLEWLRQTVWPRPWGVFALSKFDLQTLAQHFARFLLVTLPDGERWFFRFYDPRVLTNYLPNCSPDELTSFCGPVRGFAIPNSDTGQVEIMQFIAPASARPAQPSPQPGPEAAVASESTATAQQAQTLRPTLILQSVLAPQSATPPPAAPVEVVAPEPAAISMPPAASDADETAEIPAFTEPGAVAEPAAAAEPKEVPQPAPVAEASEEFPEKAAPTESAEPEALAPSEETMTPPADTAEQPPTWGLRPEQIAAIQPAVLDSFDARVAEHLQQFFPEQCQVLGTEGLKEAIEFGIQRASAYEIVLERDVCVFLDLMFTFGVNFDSEVPWAAAILNDPAAPEPSAKVERLYQAAAENVQKAMGSAVAAPQG